MSVEQESAVPDVIRWTFTPEAAHRAEIEAHLIDLGWDVHTRGEGQVVASWDEPEGDLDAIVEALWAIQGGSFEITHEEFRRTELMIYEDESSLEGEPLDDEAAAA
jgi:hypothetical protein